MLTISVKNFGPIAEGSVDLKPLTIFVGPSNTGKSYMATAVYAVIGRASHVGRIREERNFFPSSYRIDVPDSYPGEMPSGTLRILEAWVRQQLRSSTKLSDQTITSLPEEVRLWLEEATAQRLSNFQREVVDRLRHFHGEETEFANRAGRTSDFQLKIRQDTPKVNLEILLPYSNGRQPVFDISQAVVPNVPPNLPPAFCGEDRERWTWPNILDDMVNSASDSLIGKLPDRSYYLPAARSGIAQGHKVLSAALVNQSSFVGLQALHLPTLPRISIEFLSHLIGLDRRRPRGTVGISDDDFEKAIAFIEADVLQGRIIFDESAGLPFPDIAYESKAGKFTIDQTSSMVSELAPLVLFLKYLVRPGDLLILEEPESHLHPAAQRQLARGIVRLVNAGVKVLITTHSDIFVSQINNLLRASYASKRWLREHGYAPEDCIRHDDVSAYLFWMDEGVGGSRTERLEIQPDVGIDDPMFNQVIHDLYEETLLVERIRPK